ncbi:hypothetical protein NUU61_003403 [Penicillium alfredii]|uniref:Uncharacterized protein n=1 Tax=Penicillium alfredii TaxID=1506179 RepID=A0A9W9FTA2_9EURO|nr:uncharacterized protein NUU61_003403 [Penicillium alfredii]KAJ5106056.1 hypothetical protein NUU61_003403 [Penicillium alfredii]
MNHTMQSNFPPQVPITQASASFPPSTSTLDPSVDPVAMAEQSQQTLNIPSNPNNQPFPSPLQTAAAACAPQSTLSQTQALPQTLNNTSHAEALAVAPPAGNTQAIPQSGAAPVSQSGPDQYPHRIDSLGGPTATAPFLQDFNLVAEAAKRAQMGIVMRDLESVTL